MYAYGYLGVEAGIEGKVSVSLLGLNDLGSVGAALEIGAMPTCTVICTIIRRICDTINTCLLYTSHPVGVLAKLE